MSKVTFIEKEILRSKAFKELPGTAIQVLMWFYLKRKLKNMGSRGKEKWVITNNDEIVFSYAYAEKKYGLTRVRFSRALTKLIELGFIDIAYHGGGMMGDCTLYGISERWRKYGTDQFILQSRPKDTRGLGFTKENWEKRTRKRRKPTSKQGNNIDTYLSNENITLASINTNTPSNKNDTESNERKVLILKAVHQYYKIMNRSNKSVTVL
jgi:hypothetical protein